MPVGVSLVGARGLDDRNVIAGARHKLQSNGKILFREAARNGKRRKSAEIADAAEWIGIRKSRLEIQFQRCCRNRLRHGDEQIKGVE